MPRFRVIIEAEIEAPDITSGGWAATLACTRVKNTLQGVVSIEPKSVKPIPESVERVNALNNSPAVEGHRVVVDESLEARIQRREIVLDDDAA